MAAPLHSDNTSAGASPDGAPANRPDDLAAPDSSHDDIEEAVTAAVSFFRTASRPTTRRAIRPLNRLRRPHPGGSAVAA